jgi:hypothetical protein
MFPKHPFSEAKTRQVTWMETEIGGIKHAISQQEQMGWQFLDKLKELKGDVH